MYPNTKQPSSARLLNDRCDHLVGASNVRLRQGGVHQEHQAGFTQRLGHGQARLRAPGGAIERFFQINLGARARVGWNACCIDFVQDAIPVPVGLQRLRFNKDVSLVGGVHDMLRHIWNAQCRQAPGVVPNAACIFQADAMPFGHALELNAANDSLHFHHAPVGAEAFMQPAESGRMLTVIHCIPGLAVVFVRPHLLPQGFIIGRDHAAFAARGHDLVLAEGPGTDVADRTDRAPAVLRAMRLRAVFNDVQPMFLSLGHDAIHLARPAGQMNGDDGLGARRQHRCNGFRRNILCVAVHISKDRCGAGVDDGGHRCQKGARCNNHFIAYAYAQRDQGNIQSYRAVRHRHGVAGTCPCGKFRFEFAGFLPRPVVDLVREQYLANSIGFFFREAGPGGEGSIKHE